MKKKNKKLESDLVIGLKLRLILEPRPIYMKTISHYFIAILQLPIHVIKMYILNDEFLKHIEATDIELRKSFTLSCIL